MHLQEIIFKPAEERIDRQVHRTPRTVHYCTRQVKTLNFDMPLFGLESAIIQPNNLKLKPIPTGLNKTKNIQNILTSEVKENTETPLKITSSINNSHPKVLKLPESKNNSESNNYLVQKLEEHQTSYSKDTPQSEITELKVASFLDESNSETTIDRSNNLIDLEFNPLMPKSCSESHISVTNELNESSDNLSNENLYLSISNKNINKENESVGRTQLFSLSKVGTELEDILEETSSLNNLNNLRESEDVIQFISSSKSNMESEDKSEDHIIPFRTLSESKQTPEKNISLYTDIEEKEIKTWPSPTVTEIEKKLKCKISQSTSTSIIDHPSQAISCSTSPTSGKGRIPFHKLTSSKLVKSEKKLHANFFPDLYQMQVILESILVKRKPDPHYWQPTCSSKLKASDPKVFCIPTTYFQIIHELIRNKKSA